MAKRSPTKTKKKSKARAPAPRTETVAKSEQEVEDEPLPVVDDVVAAPPVNPHPPEPKGYTAGDRVVIPDMGSRHGEIEQVDEEEGLLLVKLDGPIVHPTDPTRKVQRIEIDAARVRVCRGGRAA